MTSLFTLFKEEGSEFFLWLAGLFLFTGMVLASDSFASTAPETRPLIQVGGGFENSGEGTTVLLRVNLGYRRSDGSIESNDTIAPDQVILAHISGNMSLVDLNGNQPVSFADLTFTPIETQQRLVKNSEVGAIVYGNLKVLSTQIERNIAIDQYLGVKVSVLGIGIGASQLEDQTARVYAQVAASALGYAMASHVNDQLATFHGMRIIGTNAEAGVLFNLSSQIRIRLAAGGAADINWWGSAFQSNLSAYTSLRADITRFFQIFAQAGVNTFWDSQNSFSASASQVMIGIAVSY